MHRGRLKNRRIKKRKKGINEWIVLLIVFFFIIICVEFYEFIDRGTPLRNLGIKCSKINPENLQGIAGLNPGVNLFKIKLRKIASRLNEDSKVKNVHIFKNLVEGRVEIEIKERIPFIKILRSGTDKCLEVDAEGVIIGEAENISRSVPVVTGLSNDRKTLERAIEILKMSDFFNLPMEEISEINLKDPNDIIFFTNLGTEFHLGCEDLSKRLKRASIIFAEIRKKGIPAKYVDLRFGEEAIIR